MGKRELQKHVRRCAILDAARVLMQVGNDTDFSMPGLAKKAGVSLVTPYNLFGSKSNILLEVVRADVCTHTLEIDALPTDDLVDWVTEASRTLARAYYHDRRFYWRMTATLVTLEPSAIREITHLYCRMFDGAVRRLQSAKQLRSVISAPTMSRYLSRIVSGSMEQYLSERGSLTGMMRELECGMLLIVFGWARIEHRARILARIRHLEVKGSRAMIS
jgi:AcrR family transcriptional regulator